jgi:hypothetical protein
VKLAQDPFLPKVLASLIAIVLSVAVFTVATAQEGTPLGRYDIGVGDRWAVGHRDLTIVDRTDDADWHQAIEAAIATWNAGHSALRFTLTTAVGPCAQVRDHIEYCQATSAHIASVGSDGDQGLFIPFVTKERTYKSAILLVCSDCGLAQPRRVIIATHEMGHAIGLAHNSDPFSVMFPSGGTTQPDAVDYQILRDREGAIATPKTT